MLLLLFSSSYNVDMLLLLLGNGSCNVYMLLLLGNGSYNVYMLLMLLGNGPSGISLSYILAGHWPARRRMIRTPPVVRALHTLTWTLRSDSQVRSS